MISSAKILFKIHIFHKRQGQMDFHNSYFYTDTIVGFSHLLTDDYLKMIIINALKYLVDHKLVNVYGYVIMPNHVHIIWDMLKNKGKESPAASLLNILLINLKYI